jgi:tripartite-type tricarboxylate transporter receptor subunit TctC
MSATRAANFPDVPTVEEATGHKWHKGVWRGMAGPKGMPKEIATQYEAVIKKIWDSKEFQDFMKQRGFDLVWMDSAKFAAFMKTDNRGRGRNPQDAGVGEIGKQRIVSSRIANSE